MRVMLAKPSKLSSDEYTLSGSPHNKLGPGLLRKLIRPDSPSKSLTVPNPHHA